MHPLHLPLLRILLVVLCVLATASDSHAEKRIGIIMTGVIPYYEAIHKAFIAELNRRFAGAEEIGIILQKPFPNPISWSNAARKLIAHDVDLIVTYGSPATRAAINEKSRIPVVYAGLYAPEHAGVDAKNVTGCGFRVPLSSILRYFKRIKTVNTLGIIYSSVEEDSVRQAQKMRSLTAQQNIKTEVINIRSHADLDKLMTTKSDVVFITGSSLANLWLNDILSILRKRKVPVAGIFPDDTEAGMLMTLYQPSHTQGEMAAEMAQRILLGAKPADITAHTNRDTELVLNLIEAKHLDINFPVQLLIEATKVIE